MEKQIKRYMNKSVAVRFEGKKDMVFGNELRIYKKEKRFEYDVYNNLDLKNNPQTNRVLVGVFFSEKYIEPIIGERTIKVVIPKIKILYAVYNAEPYEFWVEGVFDDKDLAVACQKETQPFFGVEIAIREYTLNPKFKKPY